MGRVMGCGLCPYNAIEKVGNYGIEMEEAQKVTELTIDKEHLHLPLLVSSRCISSEFPTRFCSKALQQ